jgi:DNA-binding HxlR family transcriptional regulator
MLIEIPDLDVIFGLVLAFMGGLFTLFVYSRLKVVSASNDQTKVDSERLEFYERQLIDLKIKLDAIDLENLSFSQEMPQNVVRNEEKPVQVVEKQVQVVPEQVPVQPRLERTPNMSSGDIVEAVLRLITDRSRTSRDIQITLGKSREHISRTMKKMSDAGLVERNTNAKPYSYSITQNGRSRFSGTGRTAQIAAINVIGAGQQAS